MYSIPLWDYHNTDIIILTKKSMYEYDVLCIKPISIVEEVFNQDMVLLRTTTHNLDEIGNELK